MPIELPKDTRAQAIASIERWCREHLDEPIGNVAAGGLLGFFLEEIGPSIYNQAVADVQERLQARVAEAGAPAAWRRGAEAARAVVGAAGTATEAATASAAQTKMRRA
jgi:uncharacterized protein (DUF2164 family)